MAVKYQTTMTPGYRGAIANMENRSLVSRTNMDETNIGFGVAVARHATQDRGCTADLSAATEVFGVSVLDRSVWSDRDKTEEGFLPADEVRIMREGTIWLPASVDVDAGDPVHVVAATGEFTNVATGNLGPIGEWDTNAAADALAVVRIHIA